MKKLFSGSLVFFILSGFFLAAVAKPASANLLELNGRVHFYNPPEASAGTTIMYGLGANLNFTENLTVSAGIEYSTYSADGHNYSLMPMTVDLMYYLMPGGPVNPYLAAGLGFYKKTTDGSSKTTTGGQLRAGVDVYLILFNASLEGRYVIPDFNDSSQSSFAYGANIGGSVFIPF